MNVYKPLIIHNIAQSIRLLSDGCDSFRVHLVEGMEPNLDQIATYLERSLMLVTALSPVIGYDKASEVAHHAHHHGLSLREAALAKGYVSEEEFDRLMDPAAMVRPLDPDDS